MLLEIIRIMSPKQRLVRRRSCFAGGFAPQGWDLSCFEVAMVGIMGVFFIAEIYDSLIIGVFWCFPILLEVSEAGNGTLPLPWSLIRKPGNAGRYAFGNGT
jgi:hypothetical protein